MRFPIRFDSAFRILSRAIFLSPDAAHVDVAEDLVRVQYAWAFRATFPRSAVAKTALNQRAPMSRGVHGLAGRWLVNGAGDRLLDVELAPPQRAYVLGFPVRLTVLTVSVDDPASLSSALGFPA